MTKSLSRKRLRKLEIGTAKAQRIDDYYMHALHDYDHYGPEVGDLKAQKKQISKRIRKLRTRLRRVIRRYEKKSGNVFKG